MACGDDENLSSEQAQHQITITPSPETPTAEIPTPTIDPNFTPSPTPCVLSVEWGETYTIQSGDTLGAIALAAGTSIRELQDANCLTDRDFLVPGQVLLVPNAFSIGVAASETGIEGLIVFIRDEGMGQRNLWAVKSDGTALRKISDAGYMVGQPSRSTDLSKVAYRVVSPFHIPDSESEVLNDLPNNIWVVDADGTNPHRLVDQGPTDTLHRSEVAWSNDGTHLIFTEQGGLFGSLVIIQEDGTQRFVITTGDFMPPDGQNPVAPAWSPDGQTIAYVVWDEQKAASLQTITPDGLTVQPYISGFEYRGGPFWAPLEGDSGPPGIAFALAGSLGETLWQVLDPTTGQIFPRPGGLVMVNEELAWMIHIQPDGLKLLNVDGLVDHAMPLSIEAVAWGPSGARLVMAQEGGLMLFDFEADIERQITEGNDLTPVWMLPGWWVMP